MSNLKIVIEDGMVSSVYGTPDLKVDVEVLDLDTDDPDEADEKAERLEELEQAEEKNLLTLLW